MTTVAKPTLVGIDLVSESHPVNYKGYPYLTAVHTKDGTSVVVIDNVVEKQMKMYVLDLANPNNLDLERILEVINHWYVNNSQNYPLSIEFSRLGMSGDTEKLLHTINTDAILRLVGPVFRFEIGKNSTNPIKRRKKQSV